jgi:hypothetical protein
MVAGVVGPVVVDGREADHLVAVDLVGSVAEASAAAAQVENGKRFPNFKPPSTIFNYFQLPITNQPVNYSTNQPTINHLL